MWGMAFLEVAGGAVLGFGLSELSARRARREEREHTRRERVRERQREAAQPLDQALEAAHASLPSTTGQDDTGQAELLKALQHWEDQLFKAAPYVRDRDLLDRYDAAGWMILDAWITTSRGHEVDTWFLLRAINNAGRACASFILDEPLPEPTFPSRAEAPKLVKLRRDRSALSDWLEAHPEH